MKPGRLAFSAVHQPHGLFMVRRVCMHGPDKAHVIDMLGRFCENLAHFHTALTIFGKFKRRCKCCTCLAFSGQFVVGGQGLAVVFGQHRLGVEGVHLRRPPVEINMNDVLRPGRKMRRPRCQRRVDLLRLRQLLLGVGHQRVQADHP